MEMFRNCLDPASGQGFCLVVPVLPLSIWMGSAYVQARGPTP
ncbi:hypothetical protein FLM9_250 [Candidatus Synechococcus spongiarum]|uniref:Uncharacterized protein n=1 Tax=Candidatus Synechococcus spongiarum TaxID=431041 RepID=A0A165B1U2_9SYNE|nr:hypothetical protein FLM9_250 [Candidatus Synechococcus spongiarum]